MPHSLVCNLHIDVRLILLPWNWWFVDKFSCSELIYYFLPNKSVRESFNERYFRKFRRTVPFPILIGTMIVWLCSVPHDRPNMMESERIEREPYRSPCPWDGEDAFGSTGPSRETGQKTRHWCQQSNSSKPFRINSAEASVDLGANMAVDCGSKYTLAPIASKSMDQRATMVSNGLGVEWSCPSWSWSFQVVFGRSARRPAKKISTHLFANLVENEIIDHLHRRVMSVFSIQYWFQAQHHRWFSPFIHISHVIIQLTGPVERGCSWSRTCRHSS